MKWIFPGKRKEKTAKLKKYSGFLILRDELLRRGITDQAAVEKFLDPEKYIEASPFDFPHMERAVDRLHRALKSGEKIGIWGDFDVDGQTSTALLVVALRDLGADVHFHVPVRGPESHGINPQALKVFLSTGINLLITCDTGITENQPVDHLKELKVDTIITDHHEMPSILPAAYAIINPHQLAKGHPLYHLAGVGVAYNFIRAYFQKYSQEFSVEDFLDLVALGTIADVAVLKEENRFYVQKGLASMNDNLRPSLKALLHSARVRHKVITENMLGFVVGPRLNSAGRLGDANENIEFLISDDQQFLRKTSANLERLNERRKLITENLFQSAQSLIVRDREYRDCALIILHHEGWEPGVLGIVAGKLAEKYNKPCILLNDEDGVSSGSARSVDGINITHHLDKQSGDLIRYGGHSMAAGLTISTDKLDDFIRKMNQSITEDMEKLPKEELLDVDHVLSLPDLTTDLFHEVKLLSPFGNGNRTPLFATLGAEIQDIKRFGANNEHAVWIFSGADGVQMEMQYWYFGDSALLKEPIDIAFYLQPDEYLGADSFKLEYVASRPHAQEDVSHKTNVHTAQIIDRRSSKSPLQELPEILEKHPNAQIFYEGLRKPEDLPVVNRFQMGPSDTLIMLGSPPSMEILRCLLEKANPEKVFLFNYRGKEPGLKQFLQSLAVVIQQERAHPGKKLSMKTLAANLGFTEKAIDSGLGWLQAHGDIFLIKDETKDTFHIEYSGTKDDELVREFTRSLKKQIAEISAFRAYYSRTNSDNLLRK